MGTPKPVEERSRIELVRKALRMLKEGKKYSRRALFDSPQTTPKGPQWQFTLLTRWIEDGLIVRAAKGPSSVEYFMMEGAKPQVDKLLADKQTISNMLWPSRAVIEHNEDEEVEVEEEGDNGEEETPSADEMLTAVLKLTGASVENVVYLRRKVDSLEEMVAEMQEQLKELRDAWVE